MACKGEDLTGKRFGRLVVLEKTKEKEFSAYLWRCRCDCGNEKLVTGPKLMHGLVKSCGCLLDEKLKRDIIGRREGHLTAIRRTEKRDKDHNTIWVWRCDCGAEIERSRRSVMGNYKTIPMCPKCQEQKEKAHMEKMRQSIDTFETGCSQKVASYIREGKPNANNSSGVRGVSWHKGRKKWCARIEVDKKTKCLGYFSSIKDAARAREEAIAQIYGTEDEKPEK